MQIETDVSLENNSNKTATLGNHQFLFQARVGMRYVPTIPEAAENSGGKKLQRTDAACQPYAAAPSPSRCADK